MVVGISSSSVNLFREAVGARIHKTRREVFLGPSVLTSAQIDRFEQDGYLILEGQIPESEVDRILTVAREDPVFGARAKTNQNFEGEGLGTRLVNCPHLEDDIFSAYVQSRRIVDPLEQLFRSKACHYYHLTMMKDTDTGGWQWHQDYGYHYKEFFYPNFISVMVALDPATRENGCLRVIKGSNQLGRLEHQPGGSQLVADPHRVELALEHMEEVYCELRPGSILYFHGNILHASAPNLSPSPRWSFVFAYVAASNVIALPGPPDGMTDLIEPWDDEKVEAAAQRHWDRLQSSVV